MSSCPDTESLLCLNLGSGKPFKESSSQDRLSQETPICFSIPVTLSHLLEAAQLGSMNQHRCDEFQEQQLGPMVNYVPYSCMFTKYILMDVQCLLVNISQEQNNLQFSAYSERSLYILRSRPHHLSYISVLLKS